MPFADTLRSTTFTGSDIASLLESSLVNVSSVSLTATINTTSTTPVDYTSGSVAVTTVAGETVFAIAQMQCSNSNDQQFVAMRIYEDGAQMSIAASQSAPVGSTAGISMTLVGIGTSTPAAGAHTYKVQWWAGANTAYSASLKMLIFRLRSS